MAVKDLVFRILGEDSVSPVFKKIAAEADVSAASVSASYKEAGASVDRSLAGTSAAGAGGFKKIGAAATAGSLVVVAAAGLVAVKAVTMGADFQTAITRLATSAGEQKKYLGMVGQGVLGIAGDVGLSAQQIAGGMYTVESAGFHAGAGLKVMAAGAKGAQIEGADLSTVVDAETTALNAYHLGAGKAAMVTNVMLGAVSRGKTTFEQLAGAMPTVLPAAAAVHVKFSEVAAGMATMTAQGTPAAKAATYLRQTLLSLASGGTAQAQTVLKGIGLSGSKVSEELGQHGLAATITTITQAIQTHLTPATQKLFEQFEKSKNPTQAYRAMMAKMPGPMNATFGSLTKVFGGVKGLQSVLELSGPHLKTFTDNSAALGKVADESGHRIEGWRTYQQTFNAKVDEAKASIGALVTGIGLDLIPVLTVVVGKIGEATKFLGEHKVEVEIAAVAVVGFAAAWLLVAGAMALATSPITLVILGLVALAAGLAIAYRDSATFRDEVNKDFLAVQQIVHLVVDDAIAFWNKFGNTIVSFAKGFLGGLVMEFKGYFQIITGVFKFWADLFHGNWSALWGDVKQILSGAWHVIEGILKVALSLVELQMRLAWDAMKGQVSSAWASIKGVVSAGVSTVVSAVGSLPGRLKALAGGFVSAGSDLMTNLLHGLANAPAGVADLARSIVNTIVSEVNTHAIDPLKNFQFTLGWHGFSHTFEPFGALPDIPFLAEGGVVTSPTLLVAGERGAEAIIPLSDYVMPRRRDAGGGQAEQPDRRSQAPTVNIERYYEAGLTPAQVAMDLLFLAA